MTDENKSERRPAEAQPAPKPTCGWCKGNPIGHCMICQTKPSTPETYADDAETDEAQLQHARACAAIKRWRDRLGCAAPEATEQAVWLCARELVAWSKDECRRASAPTEGSWDETYRAALERIAGMVERKSDVWNVCADALCWAREHHPGPRPGSAQPAECPLHIHQEDGGPCYRCPDYAGPRSSAASTERAKVPPAVHESGWQWRPVTDDTAFAPPFGTIRACIDCGCLVAGGPTRCVRCAEAEDNKSSAPEIDWIARTRAERDRAGHFAWDTATEVLDAVNGDMPQPWRNATIRLLAEHHPVPVTKDVLSTLRCVRHSIREDAPNHRHMMDRAIATLETLIAEPRETPCASPACACNSIHCTECRERHTASIARTDPRTMLPVDAQQTSGPSRPVEEAPVDAFPKDTTVATNTTNVTIGAVPSSGAARSAHEHNAHDYLTRFGQPHPVDVCDLADLLDEIRRETVEACARRVFETPEAEVPGTIAGIIEWLSGDTKGPGK